MTYLLDVSLYANHSIILIVVITPNKNRIKQRSSRGGLGLGELNLLFENQALLIYLSIDYSHTYLHTITVYVHHICYGAFLLSMFFIVLGVVNCNKQDSIFQLGICKRNANARCYTKELPVLR